MGLEVAQNGSGILFEADPITVNREGAKSITVFVYEWQNLRLGKVVSELRLKGTRAFRGADADYTDHYGPAIADNAIPLLAVSSVRSRDSARNSSTDRGDVTVRK